MKTLIFFIIGIIVVSSILYMLFKPKDIKEGFGNIPAQTIKRMPEVRVQSRYQSDVFSVPPSYQGNLPPRFSNTGYGAYILYNIPEEENLAVPKYPLTFGGNVRESYAPESNPNLDASLDIKIRPQSNSINTQAGIRQFEADAAQGQFRVGDSAELPNDVQIFNYDRLVYAQKKSRLHGLGDPIRGDLAIAPIQGDWFRPSAYPNIDLRQGAITTISGNDNATAKELRALQAEYSGKTALAQKDISFDGRQSDIFITAFP